MTASPSAFETYRRAFDRTWSDDAPLREVRFVVLDTETTGLDPRTDRIVTIGGVAVRDGEILLDDTFSALIRMERNTEAVTVHGVTRDESRRGLAEAEALETLLAWLRDGVVVGHHIGHDMAVLGAASERHWGARLLNRSLDTMDLTLHLEGDGAFAGRPPIRQYTLDSLCTMFGVVPHDRHTAAGDAFITAQVFLRLLKLATRHGRTSLAAVSQPFAGEEAAAGA